MTATAVTGTVGPGGAGATTAVVRGLLGATAALVGLWWVLPHVTGQAWSAILDTLAAISGPQLAMLALVWAGGLVAHSFVLTGALPGLTRRRALTLNLTGSAVSNVAPLGGALGVATNLAMTRAWGFKDRAFAAYTVVTNTWDVLAKLCLPIVALLALFLTGSVTSTGLRTAAGGALAGLGLVLVAMVLFLRSDRVARFVEHLLTRGLRWAPVAVATRAEGLAVAVLAAREGARGLMRDRWGQLTGAMAAYVALQAVLLGACLSLSGASVGFAVVLAGFAVDRLVSLAVVTPGGTGLAEAATAATLVSLGGAPLPVAAGVLLYRTFVFLVEIPVGGIWLGSWLLGRRRRPSMVSA